MEEIWHQISCSEKLSSYPPKDDIVLHFKKKILLHSEKNVWYNL